MAGKRIVYILVAAVAAGALGSIMLRDHLMRSAPPDHPAVENTEATAKAHPPLSELKKPEPAPIPEPPPEPAVAKAPAPSPEKPVILHPASSAPKKKTSPKLSREEQIRAARMRYWERAAANFSKQQSRLDAEQNEARRKMLIQSMAAYVRVNTLQAIEWAMSLTDPAEQRLALESINKYALSGIGARIEKDDSGFPRIRETTIMSAAGSTGMVEAGDYIVGIESAEGPPISFDGMAMQDIIKYLRGEAGSEVRLIMERATGQGDNALRFNVPVQRSLLVIQPPF